MDGGIGMDRNAARRRRSDAKAGWPKGSRGLLIAIAAAGAVALGWLLFETADRSTSSPAQAVEIDEENGLQTVYIEAGKSGYNPSVLELKAYMMTKINFRLTTNTESLRELVSPDLDLRATLKEGDNYFLIGNPQPGTYVFHSEDGRYEGALVFKENKPLH